MTPSSLFRWAYLQTGQTDCRDESGRIVDCAGSGQDGEIRAGAPWPEPRFASLPETDEAVSDRLTNLVWPRDASAVAFPLPWPEALAQVQDMNESAFLGFTDWRLPNRRELRSLISHAERKPALPRGHPFRNVFQGWVWTSTSYAGDPTHAWRVHLEGGRMFYGRKSDEALVWAVRGDSPLLPRTGQKRLYDAQGREMTLPEAGQAGGAAALSPASIGGLQDGAVRTGRPWPEPRFEPWGPAGEGLILDRLTNLVWLDDFDLTKRPVSWQLALAVTAELAKTRGRPFRMPNVNEFESLVDASRAAPALSNGHPFRNVREAYWTSTTSGFEPDWAYALYMHKGAVGVGHKPGEHFHAAAVFGPLTKQGKRR